MAKALFCVDMPGGSPNCPSTIFDGTDHYGWIVVVPYAPPMPTVVALVASTVAVLTAMKGDTANYGYMASALDIDDAISGAQATAAATWLTNHGWPAGAVSTAQIGGATTRRQLITRVVRLHNAAFPIARALGSEIG